MQFAFFFCVHQLLIYLGVSSIIGISGYRTYGRGKDVQQRRDQFLRYNASGNTSVYERVRSFVK